MNFSGLRRSSLLGTMLRAPLRLIPKDAVVPVIQGPMRGMRWIAGSANHGCWLGSYEYEIQLLFRRYVKPGSVVYDLGAHVGFYTLLASRLAGPQGAVFSFEPLPANLEHLRRHIELNRIANCRVFDSAVSSRDGSVGFAPGRSRETGALVPDGDGAFAVSTVSLDSLLSAGAIAPPHVIKCDIEGGEYDALLGARTLLKNHRPVLFVSMHGASQRCLDLLAAFCYRTTALDGRPLEQSGEVLALPQ